MGRLLVCALLFSLASTEVWASTTDLDEVTPAELVPVKTTFAYRVRHSWNPLPAPAISAMWFSGEDRELPQVAVTEPIVVPPAQVARHTPSRTALCGHAAMIAADHDLPVPFFANLIQQESGFKSHAVSPAGAQGIAQFMPRIARAYGLENPFEPVHSLSVSAKFLRELLNQFGNIGLAAAAYNAGPKRVQDWMARRGKLPDETKNYVRNITGHPAERWARVKAPTQETKLPPHARCPDMPAVEVSVPQAAPVKVAKNGAKGNGTKLAAKHHAKGSEGKTAEVTASAPKSDEVAKDKAAPAEAEGPKSAKFITLASAETKSVAVIKNGKIQIVKPEKAAAKKAAPVKVAAKEARPAKAKVVTKPAATKVAAKAAAKPSAKAKPPAGKRVKLAAAR